MSLALDGMKAKNMSNAKMPIGSRSNMKGGGGNGGSTKGRINNDAVRHMSKSNDTRLKWLALNNLLLLPCESDRLYSIFSTLVLGSVRNSFKTLLLPKFQAPQIRLFSFKYRVNSKMPQNRSPAFANSLKAATINVDGINDPNLSQACNLRDSPPASSFLSLKIIHKSNTPKNSNASWISMRIDSAFTARN
ncbi:hypothetical protein OIU74_005776 [Salix koriyanagi]|uniref:Uncharacterized protein n=1 Tax=Salix koriyanagi TaxID=2511006 RepID=A0A9Q0UPR5_9ROSI|nr:hypothetical protein OIU74_005776 [Salix koriyanagi]